MISRGGVFDKIGNWFEQSLVMLQWLRLLSENIQMVCWEPLGAPGEGIDYQIQAGDLLVAVQCKTRSSRSWSASDFQEPLRYARQRLDGEAHRYRFVSNLRPSALAEAADAARRHADAVDWLSESADARRKFVTYLGFDPDDAEQLKGAFELFRRIRVTSQDQAALNERIWEDAKLLAGDDRVRLLHLLYEMSNPEVLGSEWTAADLVAVVQQRGIRLLQRWEAISSVAWMEEFTDRFVAQIAATRRGRPEVPRAEAEGLGDIARQQGCLVLVHGSPGTGKSLVLAQAVTGLRERGMPVLAIRADRIDDPGLGNDPIGRFRSLLGERSGCLVIDQLDQAASTGSGSIPKITRMVQAAVRAGISVIIACRSVDARHETSLHQILFHLGSPPQEVLIGDYEEQVVGEMLKPLGIPLDDLGADLLALIRNPLALTLLMDVMERDGSWRVGSSTVDLVDAWCRKLASDYGDRFLALLDEIAKHMEQDRVSAIDRHLLDERFATLVDRLLKDGLLIDEGAGRVRLFHQVISDMRTALRWSKVEDATAFLGLLGPRLEQGLRHARRARLTVQRLANGGIRGTAILRDLVWHPEIRVIVRRSLLLGLAELVEVSKPLRDLVIGWLEQDERRSSILETVVRGQTAWVDALDDWFDQAWSTWPDERRNLLLDCCASVATRRGDLVARHLVRWERETPGTIARAQWAFWHDPSEDSDELFALRLAYLTSPQTRESPCDWPKLMEAHPLRAAKLLVALLERTPLEELNGFSQPDWMHGFPRIDTLPDFILQRGADVFDEFKRWWLKLDIEELCVRTEDASEQSGFLVQMVNFLGRCLGRGISLGQRTWEEVVADLPDTLRPVDGWLLLRVGRYLDPTRASPGSFSSAAIWLRSDPKWVRMTVGFDSRTFDLASDFLVNVAPQLDADEYDQLERWLTEYPDEWTVEQETYRWVGVKQYGTFPPNRRGETAFLLLPALGRNRWGAETEVAYRLLERKFSGYGAMFAGSSITGGWVGPKVPDEVADGYSFEQWVEHIGDAPDHDNNWAKIDEDSVGEHTKAMNTSQLRRLAEQRPQHYRSLAMALPAYRDRLPDETFAALADALGRTTRPDAGEDRQPLDDQDYADIVSHPAYLYCAACAREIAMWIERRAEFDWPDQVIDRLVEIAQGGENRFEKREHGSDDQLLHYRINDAACIALNALRAIAQSQKERGPKLLAIAESLVDHPDVGRRASAAMLAWMCRAVDLQRAARDVLTAASYLFVAAQHDIHHILRWLAHAESVSTEVRADSRQILIDLLDHQDAPRAEWGGIGALCLWTWGLLEHDRLTALLDTNVVARRSAARTLARWLGERDVPDVMKAYALQLADDRDEQVGSHILGAFRGKQHAHLVEDDPFILAIARSAAARRDPGHLIKACDEQGDLLRIVELVLALGEAVITGAPGSGQRWKALHNAENAAGLLVRLVQEAEQQGDRETASHALDVLDEMISHGSIGSGKAWKLVASAADG